MQSMIGSGCAVVGLLLLAGLTPERPVLAQGANTEAAVAQVGEQTDRETQDLIAKVYPAFVLIGGGSGVCISPDGYALTNHHVASQAARRYDVQGKEIQYAVQLAGNGRSLTARPVGADPRGDIVLLKIDVAEGEKLPFVNLGDSDKVKIGDVVTAVGNPFLLAGAAYEPSVSTGVVSSLHRFQSGYARCIQIDAALNPGNSGGPLFNLKGELIGINGRILSRHGMRYNTGAGYAIPVNQIKRFIEAFKQQAGGPLIVRHGMVSGLAMKRDARRNGVEVLAVRPGSEAERAGLAQGDIVVAVDGVAVQGITSYYGIVQAYPQFATPEFALRRGSESLTLRPELDLPVELNQSLHFPLVADDRSGNTANPQSPENRFIFQGEEDYGAHAEMPEPFPTGRPIATLGLRLKPTASEKVKDLGWEITDFANDDHDKPTGAADKLKVGDIVTHIGGRRTRYGPEITDCLLAYKAGDKVKIGFLREGVAHTEEITVGFRRSGR